MDIPDLTTLRCPIRGHNHFVRPYGPEKVQVGTGAKAQWLECPSGNYRWFWIIGYSKGLTGSDSPHPLAPLVRRPRFGWKE